MIRITTFIFIALFLVCNWAWHDFKIATSSPVLATGPITVEINKGASFNQITKELLDHKVSFKPFWFKVIAVQKKSFKNLKAGEYELTTGITLPEILDMFVQGKTKQHTITFPEGLSFKEIAKEIENNSNLDHTTQHIKYDQIMMQISSIKQNAPQYFGIPSNLPEGLFFPDTYYFEKHTSDIALLKRAHDKMLKVLEAEWKNKADNLPLKTPYDALILASIVEKETAQVTERPLIAGVFIRRLQTGMLLQTDPTVIYGMSDNYKGNISSTDLKTTTPYNTYQIKGLPPTPIAMPGREAINASLHPDNSNNLYFVARGDGTHQFSATLSEHNLAVNQFQRKQK
ncbi:MAG: endolytic transglycosylase MltG [Methylococcales bacterium]|jgi:UPF0755 protein